MPRATPASVSAAPEIEERLQQRLDMDCEPEIDARLDARAAGRKVLVGEDGTRGFSASSPSTSLADRRAVPAQRAVGGEHEIGIGGGGDALGALGDLAGERLLRGQAQRLAVGTLALASGVKRNPSSWPTCWPSTSTSPLGVISASSIAFSL